MIRVYIDVSSNHSYQGCSPHINNIIKQLQPLNVVEEIDFYAFSNTVKYIYSVKNTNFSGESNLNYDEIFIKIPCSMLNQKIDIDVISRMFKVYSKPLFNNLWNFLPSNNLDKNIFISNSLKNIVLPNEYCYIHDINEKQINNVALTQHLYGRN